MRITSIVFISLLVFGAYADITESNNPGIPITWKPTTWTTAILRSMFEDSLTTNPIQRYHSHQNIMMQGQNPIPNTGDLCVDFARQMVPHHWGAIAMAMDNANIADWNAEITPIAHNIATTQSAQLDQFMSWLENKGIPWMGDDFWTWEPNTGKAAANWTQNIPNSDFAGYVSRMGNGMKGTTLTGELNVDLARQMIPHHWCAIEMAQDVIANGNCDAEMVAIAQNVNQTQSAQLQEFKNWLEQIDIPWVGEDWNPNKMPKNSMRGNTQKTMKPGN